MPGERRRGMDHAVYEYSALPQRPRLTWPGDKPLALWVVLYLEQWEIDPPKDSHRPPGIAGVRESFFPDYRTFSHREYGNRVGVWRLLDLFDELGVRPTVALNAAMCRNAPRVVQACMDRGWEIAAHGTHATRMITSRMSDAEEREHIGGAIDTIRAAIGRAPVGWIGQEFGESERTPFIVAEHGLSYIADWTNDEQPYPMLTDPALLSLPLSSQWDDVQLMWLRHVSPARYPEMVRAACDRLMREGEEQGRMMSVALHPWVSGQTHRFKYAKEALTYVMTRPGIWHADGVEIAAHYRHRLDGTALRSGR